MKKDFLKGFFLCFFSFIIGASTFTNSLNGASIVNGSITSAKLASNSVTTAKITDANVTLAKLANMSTASILGRNTAGTGVPEVLSAATTKSLLSLNNVDNTSDATKNSATATLTNKTITSHDVGTPTSDLTASRTSNFINAGATVTAGQLVLLGTSSTWILTDANASTTYSGMLAISLESKTSGQSMNVALPGSFVRNDAWTWTTNDMSRKFLFISETAGAITDTAPTTNDSATRYIGYVVSSTVIFFDPDGFYYTHI